MTSQSQPMPSTRVGDGEYIVLGTSRECVVVRRQGSLPSMMKWHLFVDGERVRSFNTKRAALVYCQDHIDL
jgi:hypothetical protein